MLGFLGMEFFGVVLGVVANLPQIKVETIEPSFDVQDINITAIAGKTAILPCTISNLGSHKVMWLDHRGKTLTLDTRRIIADQRITIERPFTSDWNLYIHGVEHSDAGRYMCQINTSPVKMKYVVLSVHEQPRIIDEWSSSDVVAREGEKVQLVCNVTGVPTPKITWYRRSSYKTYKAKKVVGFNGEVLVIHNISRYCDDIYQCVAVNEIEPAASKEIRVSVQFPPEVHLPNIRISQSVGKETILECFVTANPQVYRAWTKNGVPISNDNKFKIDVYEENKYTLALSLKITQIESKDFGAYRCEANNELGRDFQDTFLYEYRPPTPAPTTQTTVRTTLRVYIQTYRTASPHRNTSRKRLWNSHRHNGVIINQIREPNTPNHLSTEYHVPTTPAKTTTQKVFTKTVDSPSNSVVIFDKDMQDRNLKNFNFSNSKKPSKKSDISSQRQNQVVHKVPPEIVEDESSRDMQVLEGKDVRLICQATGIPPPNITWFRKNKRTYGNKERVGKIGDELVIRNISRHCGGEYECMAFNGVETAVQHTIKVDVNFPPEVHVPNRKVGQLYGKGTILQCDISASPQAVSVWKFGNIEFGRNSNTNFRTDVYEEDSMRSTLTLRILSLKRKDFGIYTCEAENKFGKAKASMELYEYHVPTMPAKTTTQKVFTKTVDSPSNSVVIYDKDMQDRNLKKFDFSNSKKPSKKSDISSQRQNQVVHKERIGNGDRSSASKCSVSIPYMYFHSYLLDFIHLFCEVMFGK